MLFFCCFVVQELEKEGAKAISLQVDDPTRFTQWHDSGGVMGESVSSLYMSGGSKCMMGLVTQYRTLVSGWPPEVVAYVVER